MIGFVNKSLQHRVAASTKLYLLDSVRMHKLVHSLAAFTAVARQSLVDESISSLSTTAKRWEDNFLGVTGTVQVISWASGPDKPYRAYFFFGRTFNLVSGQQYICACAVPHPPCT